MDRLDAFLDPALNYLQDKLPPPLYSLLVTALSHIMGLSTTSLRLLGSLLSKRPQDWNMENILPPIITLIAAYLALMSFYRTATWMVKLIVFFIKWGSLIGMLSVGAGWLAALNGDGNNNLGDVVASWMNGRSGTKSRPRYNSRTAGLTNNHRTRGRKSEASHDWQYQEGSQGKSSEAQNIMQNIVDTANQVLDGNGWWNMAKIMSGAQQPAEAKEKNAKGRTRLR
ncbi:hypothetical protein DFP72DRAFT_1166325 [Ephemerocybe angulata]|uniref:Uncharacterized protein n=1 Tax=Ephemerocybe angulata TaxID=980116 RepID=A0A8H6I8X3_9AGAR|nr:hypothetical protein DFP72DRAFT_1166325 [Tulosesus angulatus]